MNNAEPVSDDSLLIQVASTRVGGITAYAGAAGSIPVQAQTVLDVCALPSTAGWRCPILRCRTMASF